MSPLISTGLRPVLGWGPVTLLVNTATRPRPPFQVSPREAQLQPELSRDPWPQSAPRDWAQDPQGSRAACPGFLWTTCGASGLAQKRARTTGSWTGLWGSHARPPPSHKTIRVLALASVELGQKEGPRVAFQKQEADVRAGSQDASVPGNGP